MTDDDPDLRASQLDSVTDAMLSAKVFDQIIARTLDVIERERNSDCPPDRVERITLGVPFTLGSLGVGGMGDHNLMFFIANKAAALDIMLHLQELERDEGSES